MSFLKNLFGGTPAGSGAAKGNVINSREIISNDGVPMVFIPAGNFMMGSPDVVGAPNEHPRHRVYVDAFYMDKYLVTFEQYDKFCEATGRQKPVDSGWGREKRPVINVNWFDANAYAKWAGKRLPTEAEYEKAIRGGTDTQYFFGNDAGLVDDYAWNYRQTGNKTNPIGKKKPNPYDLYDIVGNVWEWCSDWYGAGYYAVSPAKNPQGMDAGEHRVLRGGSWGINKEATCLRVCFKNQKRADFLGNLIGLADKKRMKME